MDIVQLRQLLNGISPTHQWDAHASHVEGYDAQLIRAAPDLLRQLIALLDPDCAGDEGRLWDAREAVGDDTP